MNKYDQGIKIAQMEVHNDPWEHWMAGKRLNFYNFIIKQREQLKTGGVGVWAKKAWTLFMVVLALPVVLIVRLLKPLVLIRFGDLNSIRLGHFATNTALYIVRRQFNQLRSIDIFYPLSPVSNYQMKKMWDRKLLICPLGRWWEMTNILLPGGEAHLITEHLDGRDPDGLYAKADVPVAFTPQEEQYGQECLRRLGIPEGAPFVCFHARNPLYLQKYLPQMDHNYQNFRDSDILTYIPAVKELLRRGYYTVRMGVHETNRFPVNDSKFIDYAMVGRTEFMDIYLPAKCHFFLGTSCGLTSIPRLFKRPIVWLNYIPLFLVHSWDANSFFIPKKLWSKSEKRFLTFLEMLSPRLKNPLNNLNYESLGIEPVDNTEEEIADLAIELQERLNGQWQDTPEDELMQKKFWSLFESDHKYHGVLKARIGTGFLRKNRDLLEGI